MKPVSTQAIEEAIAVTDEEGHEDLAGCARAELAALKAEIACLRAVVAAADEMRVDFSCVWSDYAAGPHDGIVAYETVRAALLDAVKEEKRG